MKITRRFTKAGQDPFGSVEYDRRTSRISNPTIVNALGETTATPFSSLQNRQGHSEQAG